jgi:hypothetical protein
MYDWYMVNFQEDRKCTPNTPKRGTKNSKHLTFEGSSSSSDSANSVKCHFKYKNPLLLVDCSFIPSIKSTTISTHYTVPFLPCSSLALSCRFFYNLTLCMTKLRVLVLCLSYFTDNSIGWTPVLSLAQV